MSDSIQDQSLLCSRCALFGETCCQRSQVFVTCGDVARVEEFGEKGFYEFAAPAGEEHRGKFELDPVWGRIFGVDGSRRVLRHRPGSADCHFLDARGCRLPMDVRPLVCRLYPFDYNDECIKGVYGHLCPEEEGRNPALLLAFLGMNRSVAEEWRRELYREILEEFPE